MATNPELYTENELDLSLDIKPLENPEGELHLRFYLASGEVCAFPRNGYCGGYATDSRSNCIYS